MKFDLSWLQRDFRVACRYGLQRERKPYIASFKLTHACNLDCSQCPFIRQPQGSMPFSRVVSILDELHARGDRIVIFEGGEPMLWRDGEYTIGDVIRAAKQRFDCVGITTNGTLPFTVHPDVLWVSFDGFRDTHARLRGADVFDRIVANVKASAHPRIYAHITANRVNAAEIPDLMEYLNDFVRGITIQFYYPYDPDDELFLPTNERARLIDQLVDLKRRGIRLLNSYDALKALKDAAWRCEHWLFDCVNADGTIFNGCYVHGRGKVDCSLCGFSPYTEASLAFHGRWRSIQSGVRIFF